MVSSSLRQRLHGKVASLISNDLLPSQSMCLKHRATLGSTTFYPFGTPPFTSLASLLIPLHCIPAALRLTARGLAPHADKESPPVKYSLVQILFMASPRRSLSCNFRFSS